MNICILFNYEYSHLRASPNFDPPGIDTKLRGEF